jgi:FAD/FMN-containing dehydrogenase
MEDDRARGLEELADLFGDRFERREAPEGEEAGAVASVLPARADEVRRLSEVAARCSLTLVALGAGTAPGEPAGNEDGILVRFDLMNGIRPPERGAGWVEAEPGATWLDLDKELRRTGEGLAVYPTSAPRATVGGWLATDGLGVGSFEYGRLRENVLSASVVTRGGGLREVGGEELEHFFGPGRATGIVVGARLRTRRADADLPFAAAFPGPDDAVEAVEELVASAAPLWHLALVSPVMAAARGLRTRYMLFGAYPRQREGEAWWGLRRRVLKAHGGTELDSPEAWRVWGERFYPVEPTRPTPGVVREYVPLEDLQRALLERPKAALQCTVSRSGEALLLSLGAAGATPEARSRG